jgi:hypothetical protein
MSDKYARFAANPHVAADMRRETAGSPEAPAPEAPASAVALSLTDVGGKWAGPCPACRAEGGDSEGRNMVVFEGGAFGCIRHPGEEGKEHRQKMISLCPELRGKPRRFRAPVLEDKAAAAAAVIKAENLQVLWDTICKRLACEPGDLPGSAPIPKEPFGQFHAWCSLWGEGETAWVGERYDSQEAFTLHKFEPARAGEPERLWKMVEAERLDHASGLIWKPDATNRKATSVAGRRLIVVEHDDATVAETVGLIRYAADVLGWPLRMILSTAGKGIHGLFDAAGIPPMQLRDDAQILADLGADKTALSRSATRIPGALRQPENNHRQSILWLTTPTQ